MPKLPPASAPPPRAVPAAFPTSRDEVLTVPLTPPDEARYRTLVQAISQIVWTTDPSGDLQVVDRGWTDYTGQSADEASGWGWLEVVHPDDRVRVRQLWKRALDTRSFYHIEHRLLRRDGVFRWVSARAAPVFAADGTVREWIGTVSDVDEARRAGEERARLFQAERRARAHAERLSDQLTDILESISEPFATFDREWRFVRVNEAARRALRELDVDPDSVMGRVLWEVIPEDEGRRFADRLRRVARDRVAQQFVERSMRYDRWLEIHVYPTRDGVAAYALDVSERVRADESLRFLADASRVLASSLDYTTTLQASARLSVPFLADFCLVDFMEESGAIRRLATAHADPAKQPLADELREFPPLLHSTSIVARVLRTGVSELVSSPGAIDVSAISAGRPRLARIIESLGPQTCMCVPMITGGRVVGSITCVSVTARHYSRTELAIAEELARRAAVAVEHARLHEAERAARVAAERATVRLRDAQEISSAAASATNLDEMLATLVERVRRALQTDTATVLLLSDDGRDLEVRASVGLEPEEAVGVRVGEGFSGRVAEAREPMIVRDVAAAALPMCFVCERVRSIVGVPLLANGRLVGVLHTGTVADRDFGDDDVRLLVLVADRVGTTIERARLFEAERAARAEAEAANRAKMDFLAMMSHELRTPLNAIAGYAELLELGLRGPVSELQVKDLQSIRRNERHLLALIEEVLSFAKLDAGRVELDVREIRVQAAVESAVSMVRPQLEQKQHALTIEPIDPSLVANVDLEKLQQILVNLLSNAVKFTDPRGRITVSAYGSPREVSITVRDDGIGIAAEQHERIFEPFVQLDVGLTRRVHGTGLGLSISRELAHAMNGELVVASEPEKGAAFTLRLRR